MELTSVYVGNLPWSVQWQYLKDMCQQFGNVIRADIQQDDQGRSRGYRVVKEAVYLIWTGCH